MTHTVPPLDRRSWLRLLTSLAIVGPAGGASALVAAAPPPYPSPVFPDAATILVAGPNGGDLDRWSRVIQPALTHNLPPETQVRRTDAGAPDGVTGANQFEARTAPDGQTVLLVPGQAALAWLVGDPRAQYDVTRWMSVMAVITPGVLIARPGAITPDRRPRFATAGPAGGDLPAALGIELLGARVDALPALPEGTESAALADGAVDALFLRGHNVPQQAGSLIAAGWQPVFSLGALDASGKLVRCPAFPNVPTLPELYATRRGPVQDGPVQDGPLLAAWRAAAVASQIECVLVLPHMTPAAMVALWRRAGADAAATLNVQVAALSLGLRAVGGAEATATAGAAAADQVALIELRRWLADRFGWRPS
jgi:hypothetical protein